MIEKEIERRVMDKLGAALADAGIEGVQIVGAWQTADDGEIKAAEEVGAGILTVKAFPRRYETPTIPDATIDVDISLVMRSDVDATGRGYLAATEVVASILQAWQHSYQSYHADLAIDGAFEPTGFAQGGGDIGIDAARCIWTYSMSIAINGIINW